jgi:hypothetical protein
MPSCEPLGLATLPEHTLRFHKRSVDKSGKCNAFATDDGDTVIGVLHSFDLKDRATLDQAEGLGNGYDHAIVTVIDGQGHRKKVLTYIASPDFIDGMLKPYTWYKDLVLSGGKEHHLPASYIAERIESVVSVTDPDKARELKQKGSV